jgi:hypothetical protein
MKEERFDRHRTLYRFGYTGIANSNDNEHHQNLKSTLTNFGFNVGSTKILLWV